MDEAPIRCCGCGGPAHADETGVITGLELCDACLLLMALRLEQENAEELANEDEDTKRRRRTSGE